MQMVGMQLIKLVSLWDMNRKKEKFDIRFGSHGTHIKCGQVRDFNKVNGSIHVQWQRIQVITPTIPTTKG